MFAELIDLSAPTFQPGREYSMYDVAPITLGGPTTLQLALVAIVMLGAYAFIRRRMRPQLAASARASANVVAPRTPVREAA